MDGTDTFITDTLLGAKGKVVVAVVLGNQFNLLIMFNGKLYVGPFTVHLTFADEKLDCMDKRTKQKQRSISNAFTFTRNALNGSKTK